MTGTEVTVLDMRRDTIPGQAAAANAASGMSPGVAQRVVAAKPGLLGGVPAAALLAAAGLAAATALVGGALLVRSSASVAALEGPAGSSRGEPPSAGAPPSGSAPSSASAAPETPVEASPADLDAARVKGLAALTALAARHPGDPAVLKALLLAQARDKDPSLAALTVARRLLELAPAEATDPDLHQLVLRAANGPPDVAAGAFELMSHKMGSTGPDLLYNLLTAEKMGKFPLERAEKLLLDPEVRKLASPALLVAHDLRRTIRHCASKDIIARARQQGDARSLHYLRQLLGTYKCGAFNLGTCTRCPAVLHDAGAALKAIEARRAGP